MKTRGLFVLAALVSMVCLPSSGQAGPARLRGVLLIDFAAGISNPTPSSLTFTVPSEIRGVQDLNFPPNGQRGLQVPAGCQGTFTIDLSSNPACSELGGLLVGDTDGGRALVRLETIKRTIGEIFESAVTSGAACSLFEGNVSGSDPFAGDLECSLIAEPFVWQAQINADLASEVPLFFGTRGELPVKITELT